MKARDHQNGLEAEFFVYADGSSCNEFTIDGRPTNNSGRQALKECYIPVLDGQKITVTGTLSGFINRAQMDLIVDGSFVGSRLIEADSEKRGKMHKKRRVDFTNVTSVDPSDLSGNGKAIDATLLVQSLDPEDDNLIGDGQAFGVGSIVVIISIQQKWSSQGYITDRNDYQDCILGNWERRGAEVNDPGIRPTHCTLLHDHKSIITQKANKYKQQLYTDRYGTKPFAKLVYYYRALGPILDSGGMPLPQQAYPVGDNHKELSPIVSDAGSIHDDDEYGGLFVTSSTRINKTPLRKLGGTLEIPKPVRQPTSFAGYVKEEYNAWKERQQARQLSNNVEDIVEGTDEEVVSRPPTAVMYTTLQAKDQHPHHTAMELGDKIIVDGEEYQLPRRDEILSIITSNGMPLIELVRTLLDDVSDKFYQEAAQALHKVTKTFLQYRKDESGNYICFRKHTASQDTQATPPPPRRKRVIQLHSPIEEAPPKRVRTLEPQMQHSQVHDSVDQKKHQLADRMVEQKKDQLADRMVELRRSQQLLEAVQGGINAGNATDREKSDEPVDANESAIKIEDTGYTERSKD